MSSFIILNDTKLPVLLAVSKEEQERGLMFQKWPPPNMAFVYPYPRINKFWMKDTFCALDIIFVKNNKIINIFKGTPLSLDPIGDNVFSDLVIELPFGTANKLGLKPGHQIKLEANIKDFIKF